MSPPASASDSDLDSVITSHNIQMKSRRISGTDYIAKYVCSINGGCGATFKRLDHLDRHEYHHTGIKKHACTYEHCNKSYSILTHLKRHLRVTHERIDGTTTKKNIRCTIENCDKMFTSACNMQRHIREVHENPKVYRCIYCDEKFRQKLKMRRHEIQNHTHDFPYNCKKCTKGFYQQWQYERHSINCKVYPCYDCEEVFEKWSLFIKHCKETQHGRKNYKCELCERIYIKPGELKKHKAVKHKISDNKQNVDIDMDDDNSNDVAYMCTFKGCQKIYTYLRNLKQHILTAHAGKRFKCKEQNCTSCFSSEQNLKKHMERVHKRSDEVENVAATAKKKKKTITTTIMRKQRKDAGKTLISNLTQFAGFAVDKDFDKLLRERETNALKTINDEMLMETCNPHKTNMTTITTMTTATTTSTVTSTAISTMPKIIEINHLVTANKNNIQTLDEIETFLSFALEDDA